MNGTESRWPSGEMCSVRPECFEGGARLSGFPAWMSHRDVDDFLTAGTNETHFMECPHPLKDSEQRMNLSGVIHQKIKRADAALRYQGKLQTGAAVQDWKDEGK